MGLLIERPLVHRDFQAKYPLLLSMYSKELDDSKLIFNQQVALARSQQVITPRCLCLRVVIVIVSCVGSVY